MLNFCFKVAHYLRYPYYYLARPETYGIRGIILNERAELLLVKHRYLPGWYLLGGGIGRNETPEDALRREILEEVGLSATIEERFGTYTSEHEYKRDTIHVFICRVSGEVTKKLGLELQEARFFPQSALPSDLSPATCRRLEEYLHKSVPATVW